MARIGPAPWAGQASPEPERTEDGLEIVRNRFGLFTREVEGGPLTPLITPEEELRRMERAFARPHGGQGRVRLDWDPWRA